MGWLAGAKGTVQPDVCFASWTESTPDGKLSQTSEVRFCEQPLFQKARWQRLPPPCAHGEDCWGQRAGNLSPASGPLREAPLQGRRVGSNKPFAPQVYRPGFGGTTHGKGTTSQPEARKCFPWSAAGAGAGTLLLVHSGMAQVKANKTEANTKGLLGFLSENDRGIEARSKGGAPASAGVRRPCGKASCSHLLLVQCPWK